MATLTVRPQLEQPVTLPSKDVVDRRLQDAYLDERIRNVISTFDQAHIDASKEAVRIMQTHKLVILYDVENPDINVVYKGQHSCQINLLSKEKGLCVYNTNLIGKLVISAMIDPEAKKLKIFPYLVSTYKEIMSEEPEDEVQKTSGKALEKLRELVISHLSIKKDSLTRDLLLKMEGVSKLTDSVYLKYACIDEILHCEKEAPEFLQRADIWGF